MTKFLSHILFHFFLPCVVAAALASCTPKESPLPLQEGAAVELNFSIPVWSGALTTRAGVVSSDSGISDPDKLHILCFDAEGFYLGMGENVSLSPTDNFNGKVSAKVPNGTCRVHILAGADIADRAEWMGMFENSLIASLYSKVGDDMVYWGYAKKSTPEEMAEFLVSGSTVSLLRNVAKVSVRVNSESDNNIESISLTVCNDVDKGTMAPLDRTNLSNPFQYTTAEGSPVVTIPSDAAVRETPTDVGSDSEQFFFESPNSYSQPLRVMFRVVYKDGNVKYHKIHLIDNMYAFLPIKRNHHYIINVNFLDKALGFDSFSSALSGAPSNNVYINIDDVVTSVSDTYNHSMAIDNGTSVIYTSTGSKSIAFTYSGDGDMSADDFEVSWIENDGISPVEEIEVTYSNGSGTVTFPINEISQNLQSGKISLLDTKHGLRRSVKVYATTPFEFGASLSKVGTSAGSTAKVSFSIPEDYPSELLPVEIKIATNELNASVPNLGVTVESTSDISQNWNFWYVYSAATVGEHSITMKTVRSNSAGNGGKLYLKANNFATSSLQITYE